MSTAFYWDERCFWHGGGNYAMTLPVGGLVQPGDGLPENPETKRRLLNLLRVTGLENDLVMTSAPAATRRDLDRVHGTSYLDDFKSMSDAGGGELGLRTPFGQGGFEIASLSAGLAKAAVEAVLRGTHKNAYALSRPPGHHCLPDWPNGFCLLNNIAIALEAARAARLVERVVVLDWDVHHGNGTEEIYYKRADTLAISIHQDRNYPLDTGGPERRGDSRGLGYNINVPLPPGTGHKGYLLAMERIVLPAIERFRPELIVVACGYDASGIDPLSRMLATADTFWAMTAQIKAAAANLCKGRLVMVHEGGYSEVYVPFCGHAVLEVLSGSAIHAPDPLTETLAKRQPSPAFDVFVESQLDQICKSLAG